MANAAEIESSGIRQVRHFFLRIVLVAICAEVVAFGYALATENVEHAFAVVGVVIAILVSIIIATRSFPWGAIALLISGSAFCRFAIDLGGLHARPEHLALLIAGPVIAWQFLRNRDFELATYDWLLLWYIVALFLGSGFTSPDPRMTLRWAVLAAVALAPYFILRFLVRSFRDLSRCLNILLTVAVLEAAYAIVCYFSFAVFRSTFGVTPDQYDLVPGTYGTMLEANLLGAYAGAAALLLLALYFSGYRRYRRPAYLAAFCLAFLALFIAMARSAIAGFLVGLLVVVFAAVHFGKVNSRRIVNIAAVACLIYIFTLPLTWRALSYRFGTLSAQDVTADQTGTGRLITMALAFPDIQMHPLVGSGANSLKLTVPQSGANEEIWVGNISVRVLHDSGAFGLAALVGFALALGWNGIRVIRARAPGWEFVSALLASGILYAISFQATDGSVLSFAWIHAGLLGAAISLCKRAATEGALASPVA